jgi:outer membrane receptor protein involved in Fe transport
VTTAVNSEETGKIRGFEVAYQQTYDFLPGLFTGFGFSGNYTYVDSSNVPQSTLSETDPDVAAGNQSTVDTSRLPLEGLSRHTINLAPEHCRRDSAHAVPRPAACYCLIARRCLH